VSKRVAALETRAGAPLFRRSTRALSLTTRGERLLAEARAAIIAHEAAEGVLADRDPLAGRVRLTAPNNLALARIVPMLAAFQAEHPRIEIDARLADHKVDLAREGIDLAIRVGGQLGERGRRIGTARRILVAAPAYLARAGVPRDVADLTRHACLPYTLLEEGALWEFADGASVAVRGPFAANDPQALRLAALAGLGIVLSADWLFVDDLAAGRLVALLPDQAAKAMPIHLITRPAGVAPPHVRRLAEFIAEAFAADPLLADQP
jgi:DNA-binding transcriptional LysR family regulator